MKSEVVAVLLCVTRYNQMEGHVAETLSDDDFQDASGPSGENIYLIVSLGA